MQLPKISTFTPADFGRKKAELDRRRRERDKKGKKEKPDRSPIAGDQDPPRFLTKGQQAARTARNKKMQDIEYHRRHRQILRALDQSDKYFFGD